MQYNFSNEEIALIKQGLKSVKGAESLLKKIESEESLKVELNKKMLHDFYGDSKEFEVVEVTEENNDRLEEIMSDYEDTNEMFYDDEENSYSILRDNYMRIEVAINTEDWEEWLNNHE